ncbi:MAG: thioredoxin domain-containing protein [Deltaproteobacteria bacterium]|nr:thioredoxin domain-containing protein [Deltaproteobacteria bacterium]MBW2395643.1 thioredoxin domain-containing protein [Deltaproteobacteria bacterium]
MRLHLSLSILALFLMVSCARMSTPAVSGEPGDTTAAARIDGSEITVAEVDAWIKDELFRQASQDGDTGKLHELRSQAVDNMISERLIEREAKLRGVDTDQLMQDEASKRTGVTEAEVLEFWERNKASMGEVDFETAASTIRQHLERRKAPQAAQKFIAELRKDANVEVLIEVPRIDVVATGASLGPDDAPITIIEFSDYQCPFCRRAEPIIEQVLERYPDKVRFVFQHFPLDSIHPRARAASEAALCAGEQDKFWPYHAVLFGEDASLEVAGLEAAAETAELDLPSFRTCVEERRHQAVVDADITAGRAAGVTGTPAFFVNGIGLKGAQPVEEFAKIIEAELARAGDATPES